MSEEKRALRPEEQDPKLWIADGWTARIIKNEDDEGWAVEMTRDGELEPALVGPWTMGRDKKNPKPIDAPNFAVLVKAANEVRSRHQQQLHARLHQQIALTLDSGERVRVDLDIVPDDDDPHAILTLHDPDGGVQSCARVPASFKLTADAVRKRLGSSLGAGA
jgi:hypothetical protein